MAQTPGGQGRVDGRALGLVGLCVVGTILLRLPFLTSPLVPDEAGLLIIAGHWSGGPFLYGDYFIGRGPVALAFYWLADALGGAVALRVLACIVAAGTVAAAGWAGHQLRGRAGAGWAALVAAAYASTYAFSSHVMNERLLGAALVTASCGVTLSARGHRGGFGRSVVAGVLATLPLLVVQSFADGLVFGLVLLGVSAWRGDLTWRAAGRALTGGATGAAVVVAGLGVAVALSPMTWSQLWFQARFRVAASRVADAAGEMPAERFDTLLALVAMSGVLLLVGGLVLGWRVVRADRALLPAWCAVWAMLAVDAAGMVGGADFWPDYPLQAIPALALGTALVAPSPRGVGVPMRVGAVAAAAAAIGAIWLGHHLPKLGTPVEEDTVGRWIGAAAEPGDTGLVLFGKANVLSSAGLVGPYPYLWSLLTRTLDPDLVRLVDVLESPEAPTWVVQWHDLKTWRLDAAGQVSRVLASRYRQVGTVCGREVFLLREEERSLAPVPGCPRFEVPYLTD
jgi:hypothetical protein